MPSGNSEVTFRVVGKVPADTVFLHRGVIGLNPQTNVMLARTHGDYLRQVPCTESVGIKPNFFLVKPVIVAE